MSYTRTKELLVVPPACEPVTLLEARKHCRVFDDSEDDYLAALITVARQTIEEWCWSSFITQTWAYWWDRYFWKSFIPRAPLRTFSTTLTAPITTIAQTTIVVASLGPLTSVPMPFGLSIGPETVQVQAIDDDGVTLTATRGSNPQVFASGATISFNGVSSIRYVAPSGQAIADPQSYVLLDPTIWELSAIDGLPFFRLQYLRTWPITRGYRDDVWVQATTGYGENPSDVPMPIRHAIKLLVGHLFMVRGDEPPQEMPPAIARLIANYRIKEF